MSFGQAPMQTEQQFQDAVVELAELNGWLCYHTYDSRRSDPGFPDMVMVRGAVVIFAELKTERGRVSRPQREWLDALKSVERQAFEDKSEGFEEYRVVRVYLWRPSDWDDIEKVLGVLDR